MLFRKSRLEILVDCEKAEVTAAERYYKALAAARNEYARTRAAIEMRRMGALLKPARINHTTLMEV